MGSTTIQLGGKGVTFAAVELPELRDDPVVTRRRARPSCRPTAAGPRCPRRDGCRARRSCSSARRSCGRRSRSRSAPTVRAASSWSGRASSRGTGCTTTTGKLAAKAGLADFKQWYRQSFGRHTPWGATNSTAFVTAVETALERELAGRDHARRRQAEDAQAQAPARCSPSRASPATRCSSCSTACSRSRSTAQPLAEFGPGAILGERAVLEGGAAHVDHARGHEVPGRGRAGRSTRPHRCSSRSAQGHRREHDSHVRLLFCGVRGSTPAPGAEFVRVGGHTSCVALAHDGEPWSLVLDAGTGIRARHRASRRGAVRRHAAADAPPLGPRAGSPVLRGRRPRRRRTCACCMPDQGASSRGRRARAAA